MATPNDSIVEFPVDFLCYSRSNSKAYFITALCWHQDGQMRFALQNTDAVWIYSEDQFQYFKLWLE